MKCSSPALPSRANQSGTREILDKHFVPVTTTLIIIKLDTKRILTIFDIGALTIFNSFLSAPFYCYLIRGYGYLVLFSVITPPPPYLKISPLLLGSCYNFLMFFSLVVNNYYVNLPWFITLFIIVIIKIIPLNNCIVLVFRIIIYLKYLPLIYCNYTRVIFYSTCNLIGCSKSFAYLLFSYLSSVLN